MTNQAPSKMTLYPFVNPSVDVPPEAFQQAPSATVDEKKKYKITFAECAEKIFGVCDGCGGKLEPLETVDNSGDPTFWAGCKSCQKFCWGVKKEVYDIAKVMVEDEGYRAYSHMEDPRHNKNVMQEQIDYYLTSQKSGACNTVAHILRLSEKLHSQQPTVDVDELLNKLTDAVQDNLTGYDYDYDEEQTIKDFKFILQESTQGLFTREEMIAFALYFQTGLSPKKPSDALTQFIAQRKRGE